LNYAGYSHALVVEDHIYAVQARIYAGVIERVDAGGQEDEAGESHAEHCLKAKSAEDLEIHLEIFFGASDEEVDNYEHYLAHEEEVVYSSAESYRQRENAAPLVLREHLKCQQQQREKRRNIVEMVKEHIVELEARERVQHSADKAGVAVLHEAAYVSIRGDSRHRSL